MSYIDRINDIKKREEKEEFTFLETTIQTYASNFLGLPTVVILNNSTLIEYDSTSLVDFRKIVGITNGNLTTSTDNLPRIVRIGTVYHKDWGLIKDSVYYASTNGTISTVPPSVGVVVRVGIALDEDNLDVRFSEEVLVVDDTSVQQIELANNQNVVSTRSRLNFIDNEEFNWNIFDDVINNKTDIRLEDNILRTLIRKLLLEIVQQGFVINDELLLIELNNIQEK